MTTPIEQLTAGHASGPEGQAIYTDLGDGATYGSVFVRYPGNTTPINVPFTAAGVAALNASVGGSFAVGGDFPGGGYLFGSTNSSHQVQLIIDPATCTTTSLTVSPSSQQYSDKVTLTASVSPAAATGTVQSQKSTDNGATFANLDGPQLASGGVATLADQQILDPAGTPVKFRAVFTGSGAYLNSTSPAVALTVMREDASIQYDSGNPVAKQVSAPGSGSATGPVTFTASVKERTLDNAGETGGTTASGDITRAGLSMSLVPVGGGAPLTLPCVAGSTSGSGYDRTVPFTCTLRGPVPLGTYEVVANVTGNYYTGAYMDAFTVYDPSLGFATGGGTYLLGGDKVNFGFTTKYNQSLTNLQGNLIAVCHHNDGTVSRLKSNALGGLAIQDLSGCGIASFNGKSTYTVWDPAANSGYGDYVTTGNQPFAIYAQDCGEPGTGVDKIWMMAPGDLNMGGNAATDSQVLTGGNIAVPHQAG